MLFPICFVVRLHTPQCVMVSETHCTHISFAASVFVTRWARAPSPKRTHAKWQAHMSAERWMWKKNATIALHEKGIITAQDTFGTIMKTNERSKKWKKKNEHQQQQQQRKICGMQLNEEGLCSAATYYLLKGVRDETDRFNSHHVVSHAYNYPLSIYAVWESTISRSLSRYLFACSTQCFTQFFKIRDWSIGCLSFLFVRRFYDLQIGKWIDRNI